MLDTDSPLKVHFTVWITLQYSAVIASIIKPQVDICPGNGRKPKFIFFFFFNGEFRYFLQHLLWAMHNSLKKTQLRSVKTSGDRKVFMKAKFYEDYGYVSQIGHINRCKSWEWNCKSGSKSSKCIYPGHTETSVIGLGSHLLVRVYF